MQIGKATASKLLPNPGYYGWVVVGVGFLCSALSSVGQSFAFSLYLDDLIRDLGISRVELSSLYAGATLAAAVCLPLVGRWADRTSGRTFLTAVLALLALALLFFANVQSVVMLGAAFFTLRLLGQGAIGLGTLTEVVRWFRRYRGRALALVALGYAFGEMVFPSTIYALQSAVGWRGSLLVFAALYLLVFAPLAGWLLRERTSEPLDGEAATGDGSENAASAGLHERSFSFGETIRMPVFWGMLACVAVPPLVSTAVVFHQVALFASQGWRAALVPAAFMASALCAVFMTYTTGLLLERVPSRFGVTLAMALMVTAFASMSLPLPPGAGTVLYGAIIGLASGTISATNSIVWPDYFGVEALGTVKGLVNAVRNGATAIGPPMAALLVTADGAFTGALVVFGAMAGTAGLIALFLRPPVQEENPLTESGLGWLQESAAAS